MLSQGLRTFMCGGMWQFYKSGETTLYHAGIRYEADEYIRKPSWTSADSPDKSGD